MNNCPLWALVCAKLPELNSSEYLESEHIDTDIIGNGYSGYLNGFISYQDAIVNYISNLNSMHGARKIGQRGVLGRTAVRCWGRDKMTNLCREENAKIQPV